MPSPDVVKVDYNDEHDEADAPVIVVHTDLAQLTFVTYIEPADDRVLHVYHAHRDKLVETGDIVFRRVPEAPAKFYHVDYATTLRYPVAGCGTTCNPLPYQLFLQLDPITDEARLTKLRADLADLDGLPF